MQPSSAGWWPIVIMAIVWNAVCLGIGFAAYDSLREQVASGEYLILLLLLFPLLGFGLAVNAIRSIIHARRLGRMWLELKTVPASVGQFLGGVLHSDREMNLKHGVRLTLTCFKETLTTSRSSKGRSGTQLQVAPEWSETQVLERELLEHDLTRTALPVYFKIPRDAPGTRPRVEAKGYRWQLEVTFDQAARANLMSAVCFDVPVFETAASREPFAGPVGDDPVAEFKSNKPLVDTPEAEGVRIAPSRRGGTVFNFQAPDAVRSPGCSGTLLVMVFLAAAVAWHFWRPEQSLELPLIAAGVGLLLLLLLSYIWLSVHRLTLDRGEAEYEHTLFGFGTRKKFEPSLIAAVKPERNTRGGNEILWDLPLVLLEEKPDGLAYRKRHLLMRGLPQATAESVSGAIAHALEHALGGEKREYRVASGSDPAIAQRAARVGGRFIRTVYLLVAVLLVFVAWQTLYSPMAEVRQTEPFRFAMETLQANATAREVLGEPIKAGWFVSGPFHDRDAAVGWANLSIPVSGSRAAGRLHVEADKHEGQWSYQHLALTVNDRADELQLLPGRDEPLPAVEQ